MAHRNRIKRRDNNHNEITKSLEICGFSVVDLSQVGGGVNDILVGAYGLNFLFEIKNPESSHGVTEGQSEFHAKWQGQAAIIYSAVEAIAVINQAMRKAR